MIFVFCFSESEVSPNPVPPRAPPVPHNQRCRRPHNKTFAGAAAGGCVDTGDNGGWVGIGDNGVCVCGYW